MAAVRARNGNGGDMRLVSRLQPCRLRPDAAPPVQGPRYAKAALALYAHGLRRDKAGTAKPAPVTSQGKVSKAKRRRERRKRVREGRNAGERLETKDEDEEQTPAPSEELDEEFMEDLPGLGVLCKHVLPPCRS